MDDFEKQMARALEMQRRLSHIPVRQDLSAEELNNRIEQIARKASARLQDPARSGDSPESLGERLTKIEIKRGLKPPPPPE